MHRFFILNSPENNIATLDEKESLHCIRTLRHKVSDEIELVDGNGNLYKAEIKSIVKNICIAEVKNIFTAEKIRNKITIAVAGVKHHERNDWMVEKLAELGVSEIAYIQTQRSERTKINLERLNRIAISAMKQSKNLWLTVINSFVNFSEIKNEKQEVKLIASCRKNAKPIYEILLTFANNNANCSTQILIGPEGDFTDEEYNAAVLEGYIEVKLNQYTLRTETAAIAAAVCLGTSF